VLKTNTKNYQAQRLEWIKIFVKRNKRRRLIPYLKNAKRKGHSVSEEREVGDKL
jgi:hypothetical protein